MAFPEGNLAPVPLNITVESALSDALDTLDPERKDPILDYQVNKLLRLSIKTSQDVVDAEMTVATIGRILNSPIKR